MPLSKITKENWLSVTNPYRRSFFLEEQFRVYYVDYLLPLLGDRNKIYKECSCKKKGKSITRVDNVIVFKEKYLPVEVKLNVNLEKKLNDQLDQYIYLDSIQIEKDKIINGTEIIPFVLLIDTETVYLYDGNKKMIVFNLDDLCDFSAVKDLCKKLRKMIPT